MGVEKPHKQMKVWFPDGEQNHNKVGFKNLPPVYSHFMELGLGAVTERGES